MKKSIICLSFVLAAIFSNAAIAGTGTPNKPEGKTITRVSGISGVSGKATALAVAIAKGDVETVKKFVSYGIDINEKSNNMTPLMLAARYNKVEIINLLLENGANVKATNSKGFTALKYAQLSNAAEAVTVLTQTAAQ